MRTLILTLALGSLLCGCSAESPSAVDKQTNEAVPAAAKASHKRKLFALAKERLKSTADIHVVYQQTPKSFRRVSLEKNIGEGLTLIEKLLAYPDLTPEEIDAVRSVKAELLFYGATNFASKYSDQLRGMAMTALSKPDGSKSCRNAVTYWLRIKYADPESNLEAAGAAWLNFARVYPNSQEASETLSQISIEMMEQGKVKETQSLIASGEAILTDPNFEEANSQIKALQNKYQTARVALVANKRKNYHDKVLAKMKGRKSGYFVLYSKEKRGNNFNYAVHRGFDGVLKYAIKADRKKWNWKMVKNFPDTPDGFERAVEHKTKLVRENSVSFRHFTAD